MLRSGFLVLLAPVVLMFGYGCASRGGEQAVSSGPVWAEEYFGVAVYHDRAPQGVSRVIGTVYVDAHNLGDATSGLAREAQRLGADAIIGVQQAQGLPGLPRSAGGHQVHIRTWSATAVLLDPMSPTQRRGM